MKHNCMKKYLNDLKRNESLWIVGQSGEKLTMLVISAFTVSCRPVIKTMLFIIKPWTTKNVPVHFWFWLFFVDFYTFCTSVNRKEYATNKLIQELSYRKQIARQLHKH